MNESQPRDRGEPAIRTIPMPSDVNSNGDIFGGWVLAQMDVAGGIVAAQRAKGRVATVAIAAMSFHQPIKVGDVVSVYANVSRVGRTSISVEMETVVRRRLDPAEIRVTEGTFVYVAIDDSGRPRPVPK
jgi:acyl-CoA thioesterase YciA